MNKSQKNSIVLGSAIIAILAIMLVVVYFADPGLFSFAASCPFLPTTAYSGAQYVSPQDILQPLSNANPGLYVGPSADCFVNYKNGTTQWHAAWSAIDYYQGSVINTQWILGNIWVTSNYSQAQTIISDNNDQIPALQAQITSWQNNNLPYCSQAGPSECTLIQDDINDYQNFINVYKSVNAYESSLQPPTTTTSATTPPTSMTSAATTATTTIQTQQPPSNSPPNFSFSAILSSITGFINSLFANIQKYFALPGSLFSIAVNGTESVNSNATYIGTPLTAYVSLAIPSNETSTAWQQGNSRVQNTECASYVYQNSTKQFAYQSPLSNATSTAYTNSFVFTPQATGIYVFGAACQYSETTFSNGAWSSWSTPVTVVQENRGIAVLASTASLQAPTTQVPITNQNFFSGIAAAINSFVNAIANFFKSLGL